MSGRLDRIAASRAALRADVLVLFAVREHEEQALPHRHGRATLGAGEERGHHPLEGRPRASLGRHVH